MSDPLGQVCDQIRQRLEVVGNNLLRVSQGTGKFTDPNDVYMQIVVSITRLDLCQREMLRHNLLGGP
jgi:hypothetical protein